MGRRDKRRKFEAAGGEFPEGEFTSPEDMKPGAPDGLGPGGET